MFNRQKGFTIVELTIVLFVIGILVTIVSLSYANSQAKSRDVKRLSDAKAIEAALESYRSENTGYPASTTATQLPGASTGEWETSGAAQPGTFLSALKPYGFPNGVPVDPLNSSLTQMGKTYKYSLYPAGSFSCDINKGAFYVFAVYEFETTYGTSVHSPGFTCGTRNWSNEGLYVVGHFVEE